MSGPPAYEGEQQTRFSDETQRVLSRRTRELQAEAGVTSFWTPPSIKGQNASQRAASPTSERRPEERPMGAIGTELPYRRARAGTLPSSFGATPGNEVSAIAGTHSFSPSPFRPGAISPLRTVGSLSALPEGVAKQQLLSTPASSNVASPASSRLRGNSLNLPQRKNPYSNPFGPSIFSSSTWAGHGSGSPHVISPAVSNSFSRDDEQTPIKTLDYLGLADTPTPPRAMASTVPVYGIPGGNYSGNDIGARHDANRVRSYSVNNTEKYEEYEEDYSEQQSYHQDIYRTTPARPRSRTAGILESPPALRSRNYAPLQSHMENTVTAADLNYNESQMPLEYGDFNASYMQNQPTRALWLGNVPPTTPSAALLAMFSPFGSVESARVLTHKSCAFVNFDQLESAVVARATFNGKELFPGIGPIRIGFAKVPTPNSSVSPEPYVTLDPSVRPEDSSKPPSIASIAGDLESLLKQFDATSEELEAGKQLLASSIEHSREYREIPLAVHATTARKFDAPRLREIRKRIDSGLCSEAELEDIAEEMMDEVAELSSDYLGNTVVQKLFENCSDATKLKMLKRIGPALAETGIHKNGTWAAQKIIDVAETEDERQLIVSSLRPYVPALFQDQFGNYVVQCCLKFGSRYNNFIFEAMLSHTWEIAQGRFGSRAMRACLESHDVSKVQQKTLAAAITLHSVQLSTNTNGALLLTWLLDTCLLPSRFTLLAKRMAPYIAPLGVHKLASLTLLKIMGQRHEPEGRDVLIQALFFEKDGAVLDQVLRDAVAGPGFVFKMLGTPCFDSELRAKAVSQVRHVLQKNKTQPTGPYKRLMDEVGLYVRPGASSGQENAQRHHHNYQGQQHQQAYAQNYQAYPRSTHVDHATLRALGELSIQGGGFGTVNAQSMQQLSPLQYQALLQQGLRMSPGPYTSHNAYTLPQASHFQPATAHVAANGNDQASIQSMYGASFHDVNPAYTRRKQ